MPTKPSPWTQTTGGESGVVVGSLFIAEIEASTLVLPCTAGASREHAAEHLGPAIGDRSGRMLALDILPAASPIRVRSSASSARDRAASAKRSSESPATRPRLRDWILLVGVVVEREHRDAPCPGLEEDVRHPLGLRGRDDGDRPGDQVEHLRMRLLAEQVEVREAVARGLELLGRAPAWSRLS